MYQAYQAKAVNQKKTDRKYGYKESAEKLAPCCLFPFYSTPEFRYMAGSPKNYIIQKYNDNAIKKIKPAEAMRILENICSRHNTTPREIHVDIHNIGNYYKEDAGYTERELAEVLSLALREELIEKHNLPKTNLYPTYEGHDVSKEEDMVYCIKSFLRKMIFCHFTKNEFVERILNEGLNPIHGGGDTGISRANGGNREDTYAKWSKGFVFITRNPTDIANYSGPGKIKLFVLASEEDLRIDVDSHGLKSKKVLKHVGRADSPVTEGAVNFVLEQMLSHLYIPSGMQEKLPGLIRANFKWNPSEL
ncbi:MAG: hypothetical protein HFH15_10255 [Ruminococcus sp.]|jgi:hypothetical protein|nr:hypothetical protein [Ruminococcus sp.]